jgi:sigma-E factor negative regulatory protein RseB
LKYNWVYIALSLFLPAVVLAENASSVETWLQKMHQAAHTSNYTGKFVYQQDNQLTLMRIIHAANEEGEQERLISLDGVGREVIRSKGSVTCILPDSKSVVVEKGRPEQQFPPVFPVTIENLSRYYQFSLDRLENVAGRIAQKIVISPNDQYRYGHKLWVDYQTGLLLKTHLVDKRGNLLEQFMFTEIEFLDTVPEEMLKPTVSGEKYTWHEAKGEDPVNTADMASQQWVVGSLPAGFTNDMRRRHHMPNQKIVRQLVFTDGLASVSVFIEKYQKNMPNLVGASRMGAVNAYGRLLQDHHITAVGEVPRITVQMITESVEYKAK